MTETKSRAGEGLSPVQSPAAEAKAAMTGFLKEFSTFQEDVKSTLKHQEERLTMLNAKTMSYGRPALSARAEVEAPHQKAFNAYLRSGDDDGLRGLSLEGKATGPHPRFIHAYTGHGVIESSLSAPWERRIAARFAFPEGTK